MSRIITVVSGLICFFAGVLGHTQTDPCDVNLGGAVNVVNVQFATNTHLGVVACTINIAGPGECIPQAVQTIINTALGGICSLHYVTLNWAASASPGIAGYNVYRSTASGGPYTKLTSSLLATLTFTDTTALAGQNYYYVATAVDNTNTESSYSAEAFVSVPTP